MPVHGGVTERGKFVPGSGTRKRRGGHAVVKMAEILLSGDGKAIDMGDAQASWLAFSFEAFDAGGVACR
jgi:hypothetical protein